MDEVNSLDTIAVVKSPFQLFSAFTEQDKDKFFGREAETELLYQSVQEANVVLLYGESGTGKTSIVQCGLLNETKHFNWTAITIRREEDINQSLFTQLKKPIDQALIAGKDLSVTDLMQEVFLNNFQPILLIFDQFEEIFVFGNEEERTIFSNNIAQVLKMRIPWKIVVVIREDFLAQLDEFENNLPDLFKKRLRIPLMDKSNCRNVITRSCKVFNIELNPVRLNSKGEPDTSYNENDPDVADNIINTVSNAKKDIHLPYMQVFMDKLWKEAWLLDHDHIKIDRDLVTKVGNMGDVLKGFLEEKVNGQEILGKVDTWKFLKLFVPEKGTTRKKVKLSEYTAIPLETLQSIVSYFVEYKILTGFSDNVYELAHESLVPIIQGVKLNEMRPRLTTPTITGNPYKGLASFDQQDNDRFYGRKDAVNALYEKVNQQNLLIIVGNSGSGKSSLIKAGVLPLLEKDGYKVLSTVRAGDRPLQSMEESLAATKVSQQQKYILLIDQYEELITRVNEKKIRDAMYATIFDLLEAQKNLVAANTLKIILTVRADFEPQFRIAAPLDVYWEQGKYIVPPFTREEIREVIEEPAYQAGLEFSPPSLVEKISEEVYSSQATGLLPLMSFTLKALFDKYEASTRKDNLLMEADYNALGGVIGGLQNRAELIYHSFKDKHPAEYSKYQDMMQNIILRMIYLSTGELAGQRVLEDDLLFNDDESNTIKDEVLKNLLDSHLIVTGKDNKGNNYYEPAHDVLVRSWGQIWDWIGVIGKEKLFLRSRLTQAVNDYRNSNNDTKLLWDNNPWLNDLVPEMNRSNCWLNKKEFDFVALSKKQKEDSQKQVLKEQEEKTALLNEQMLQKERSKSMEEQFRLTEEKRKLIEDKNRLTEEKVEQQVKTIQRSRSFRTILLIAFGIATGLGIFALYLRNAAVDSANTLEKQKNRIDTLYTKISFQKDSLQRAKNSLDEASTRLQVKNDSISSLIALQKIFVRRADSMRNIALKQRQFAVRSASQLFNEVQERKIAEGFAQRRGDTLRDKLQELEESKAELDIAKRKLDSTYEVLRTMYKSLQYENGSQLASISKSLENTDIDKAYRLAEFAYKKDSFNKDVSEQYSRLASTKDYYYTKVLEGDFSTFSSDGQYVLTTSSANKSIKLWQNGTFTLIDSLGGKDGLISAAFSAGSQYIIMTYENRVEISRPSSFKATQNFIIKNQANISSKFSADETKVLVVTKDQLQVFTYYGNKLIPLVTFANKERIVSAFFSEDSKRIVAGYEKGTVSVWDMLTGKEKPFTQPKNLITSYISPKGSYFLIKTTSGFNLYNSLAEKIDVPNSLNKYGQLNSVIFSEDGKKALLGFNSVALRMSQQQEQEQRKSNYSVSKFSVILMDLYDPSIYSDKTNGFRSDDTYLIVNNSANIMLNGDYMLLGVEQGLVRLTRINNDVKEILAGHKKPVRSIAVFNNGQYILTSADDNTTRVWQYDKPTIFDEKNMLPALTAEDLKELGISK